MVNSNQVQRPAPDKIMANLQSGAGPVPDVLLDGALRNDPQLTMEFIFELWDGLTHCVEPDGYHEVTERLQEALQDHSISAASAADTPPGTLEKGISGAGPVGDKKQEWEGMNVYRISLDDSGSPIPDPDWPVGFRFVKVDQPEGEQHFQLFRSERDATIVDTTDPATTGYALPELKQGSGGDHDHFVY